MGFVRPDLAPNGTKWSADGGHSGGHSGGLGAAKGWLLQRMRPYSGESTPSRPIWEVKHRQAQLVLR